MSTYSIWHLEKMLILFQLMKIQIIIPMCQNSVSKSKSIHKKPSYWKKGSKKIKFKYEKSEFECLNVAYLDHHKEDIVCTVVHRLNQLLLSKNYLVFFLRDSLCACYSCYVCWLFFHHMQSPLSYWFFSSSLLCLWTWRSEQNNRYYDHATPPLLSTFPISARNVSIYLRFLFLAFCPWCAWSR
jgi:hypothetical protein